MQEIPNHLPKQPDRRLILKKVNTLGADCTEYVFSQVDTFSWSPGQWMFYKLPHTNPDERGIARKFTIASASGNEVTLVTRFYQPSSSFKTALKDISVGERVVAEGPYGTFVLPPQLSEEIILVAGGVGIAPFKAFFESAINDKLNPRFHLLYSNKTRADMVYQKEILEWQKQLSGLRVTWLLTRDEAPGYITTRLDAKKLCEITGLNNKSQNLVMISGPKPLTHGLKENLLESGYGEELIKTDTFTNLEIEYD